MILVSIKYFIEENLVIIEVEEDLLMIEKFIYVQKKSLMKVMINSHQNFLKKAINFIIVSTEIYPKDKSVCLKFNLSFMESTIRNNQTCLYLLFHFFQLIHEVFIKAGQNIIVVSNSFQFFTAFKLKNKYTVIIN